MHILTMVIAVYPVPLIGFVLFVLSLKHFCTGKETQILNITEQITCYFNSNPLFTLWPYSFRK